MIKLPCEVKTALNKLHENGYEAYIVGGCVRDSLLGQEPKDYDITTSALPEETKSVFSSFKIIETGIKHGTVTVLINNIPLEITTYRIDSEYKDNRHPDAVIFTRSLREDTARRDFTINAIAYSDKNGIVDYFNGSNDIKSKLIRCVGNADNRFTEDALRIMRALRFSSVLGFNIEKNTKKAIFNNKELLLNISSERISCELLKLLCGKNAKQVIMEYIDVFGVIIPELLPMKGFDQKNCHHIYDILEHSAVTVENIPPEPALRLAALLHDIGKPHCFFIGQDGMGHFYGHAKISADMSERIMERLKLDNATRSLTVTLVKAHDVQIEESEKAVKRALNKYTVDVFFKLILLKRADNLAQNPEYIYRQKYYDRIEMLAHKILEERQCFCMKDLAVNGNDLIDLGISPGPKMGKILDKILDKVISGSLENEKAVLLDYVCNKYIS